MTYEHLKQRLERAANWYPDSARDSSLEDIVLTMSRMQNYSLMPLVAVDLARYVDELQSGKNEVHK